MDIILDPEPLPPPVTLMDRIRQLEPGQSFWVAKQKHSMTSIRSLSTRVKRESPGRKFKFADDDGGARIWRVA